jgi:hypothetical protein
MRSICCPSRLMRSRQLGKPLGSVRGYVVRFAVWALAAAVAISCPRASSPASRSNIDSSVAWFGVMAFTGSPGPCTSTKDGPRCRSTICTLRSGRSIIPNFARASFLGNVSYLCGGAESTAPIGRFLVKRAQTPIVGLGHHTGLLSVIRAGVVMKHLKELVPLAVMGSLSAAIIVLFAMTVMH